MSSGNGGKITSEVQFSKCQVCNKMSDVISSGRTGLICKECASTCLCFNCGSITKCYSFVDLERESLTECWPCFRDTKTTDNQRLRILNGLPRL